MSIDPDAGWVRAVAGGFCDLIGPIWRLPPNLFAFEITSKHVNLSRTVHGGMLTAFADQIIGLTVIEAVQEICATIQLDSYFLGTAVEGETIVATVEIARRTRSVVFANCKVRAGERDVSATHGVWKIKSRGTASIQDSPSLSE